MSSLFSLVAASAVIFATTNMDDLLVLTAFFADREMSAKAIVAGQYVGIFVLTAGSVLAALLALNVPAAWLGVLGIAPFALGVRALVQVCRERNTTVSESEAPVGNRSQWMTVALITLANGGDNVGVYIPLFAKTARAIPIHIAVFATMTGVWCLLSHSLVRHRVLGSQIRRYGRIALPIVLIWLGISLMWSLRGLLK